MDNDVKLSRRLFLQNTLASGAMLLSGCSTAGRWTRHAGAADDFIGGKKLGELCFIGEGAAPLDTAIDSQMDGRMFYDLAEIPQDSLVTPTDRFYLRTFGSDLIDLKSPWKVQVAGLVAEPLQIAADDLRKKARFMGTYLMECSGNCLEAHFGMLSACRWSGVSVAEILAQAGVQPEATYIEVSGFDKYSHPSKTSLPGASWIFRLSDLMASKAFLATQMNGSPLTYNHGYPVRLFVPGWYGCTCIKWVNEINLLDNKSPATAQMREFAGRTHQDGVPQLAREYRPAKIQQAAMPVKVEKWLVAGEIKYKVLGVMWGGNRLTDRLAIRFNPDQEYVPVDNYKQTTNETWTLWSHCWVPVAAGQYKIQLKVLDPAIPTIRLDRGFYVRTVDVTDVRQDNHTVPCALGSSTSRNTSPTVLKQSIVRKMR